VTHSPCARWFCRTASRRPCDCRPDCRRTTTPYRNATRSRSAQATERRRRPASELTPSERTERTSRRTRCLLCHAAGAGPFRRTAQHARAAREPPPRLPAASPPRRPPIPTSLPAAAALESEPRTTGPRPNVGVRAGMRTRNWVARRVGEEPHPCRCRPGELTPRRETGDQQPSCGCRPRACCLAACRFPINDGEWIPPGRDPVSPPHHSPGCCRRRCRRCCCCCAGQVESGAD